VSIWLHLI